jgi:hypothetical protein
MRTIILQTLKVIMLQNQYNAYNIKHESFVVILFWLFYIDAS